MAFYSATRKCYVSKETNKRYKGLAKYLRETYFSTFRPPRGLGSRLGPAGLKAGGVVDRATSALDYEKKLKRIPSVVVEACSKGGTGA